MNQKWSQINFKISLENMSTDPLNLLYAIGSHAYTNPPPPIQFENHSFPPPPVTFSVWGRAMHTYDAKNHCQPMNYDKCLSYEVTLETTSCHWKHEVFIRPQLPHYENWGEILWTRETCELRGKYWELRGNSVNWGELLWTVGNYCELRGTIVNWGEILITEENIVTWGEILWIEGNIENWGEIAWI